MVSELLSLWQGVDHQQAATIAVGVFAALLVHSTIRFIVNLIIGAIAGLIR